MSEVRKGTSRNTENENKRCKIFNKVLNMNWDYVRGKKTQRKIKINKQRGKQTNKINKQKLNKNLYDSLVLYLTKKWLNR
jgi:acyl-homoserine lactone acylase PvdQ